LSKASDARRGQGRHADAERLYQRALNLAEELFGAPHHEVMVLLSNLAAEHAALGHPVEAESFQRRASEVRAALSCASGG
jgi:predicted Zn-dependent protease